MDGEHRNEEAKSGMSQMMSWLGHATGSFVEQLSVPATPIILACLCLAVAYRNRNRDRPPPKVLHPVLHRSLSMAALHGGRVALKRILDAQEARIDKAALESAARELGDLLAQEPLSFKKLQKAAAKLEMSGKEEEAVKMLRKAWETSEKGGQPHEAYELEMLLVEMLIYKGAYEQALDCKCLFDKEISDARGPLYKAVIYTIIGNKKRAKECHSEFQNIRNRFDWPDSFDEGTPLHGAVHDLNKFEKIVNNLKREIEHAHGIKAT